MPGTMLILRGITNLKVWPKYPNGALDEPPALEYASKRGYVGRVLDVSGETGDRSPQTRRALHEFLSDSTITALYGFSGGGYNVLHIIKALPQDELSRIELLVVLGAEPTNSRNNYTGPWELIYRGDPPGGHMDGPRALLATLQ